MWTCHSSIVRRERAAQIRSAAEMLIEPENNPGEQREAATVLFEILSGLVGLNDSDPTREDIRESQSPAGKAISPQDAARCLKDFARTRAFLRGVLDAISTARSKFGHKTVHVLYAGCGPFAPLVLPIAHLWPPDEVRFTLLDVHSRSLKAAQQIASELAVLDRIEGFIQADAAAYESPAAACPHVLITETMQRALEKEPQVSIAANLVEQLKPGGVMVPEEVNLYLTLMNPGKEFAFDGEHGQRERLELGRVMVLNRAGMKCNEIVWPDDTPENMQAFIRTKITVFGEISLGDYQSGLTMPLPLQFLRPVRPGQKIRFEYDLRPQPRLKYTVV